jgi:hypothetical protein
MEKSSFREVWNTKKWRELRTNCNSFSQRNNRHQCSRCAVRVGYTKFEDHIMAQCEDYWPFLGGDIEGDGA